MKEWVAIFSRTGSEILEISRRIGKYPDLVLANTSGCSSYMLELEKHTKMCKVSSIDVFKFLNTCNKDTVITLHGFLHIIPEHICERLKGQIYNGHPALITKYPELKGLNPQHRTWIHKEKYPSIGVVIHEVVGQVDEGPIIASREIANYKYSSEDMLYEDLHKLSIKTWTKIIGGLL